MQIEISREAQEQIKNKGGHLLIFKLEEHNFYIYP